MRDGDFILQDDSNSADLLFCPLINGDCRGSNCQWWVTDYMEDRGKHRSNCAIAIIAMGITDEGLLKLRGKG